MVNPADAAYIKGAMRFPLLLDWGSGIYWDFDFEKEEFRVGTACNTGLLVDFTQKYDAGRSVDEQLSEITEKAKEYYHYEEKESFLC